MSDDLDDLLSPQPAPKKPKRGPNAPPAPGKRRRGRPTKAEAAAYAAQKAKELAEREPDDAVAGLGQNALPDAATFHRPVTRTFLATILGKQPRHLVKQLANCPVIDWTENGGARIPLYDFKTAIRYCVDPPAGLIAQWIKSQSSTTLPPLINKAFWEAEAVKQRVEKQAGDLWVTEDVLEVLGRTALTIKESVNLWIENLPGKASITTEQYNALRREAAGLLDDIHQRLVAMPAAQRTRSLVARVEDLASEASGATEDEPEDP